MGLQWGGERDALFRFILWPALVVSTPPYFVCILMLLDLHRHTGFSMTPHISTHSQVAWPTLHTTVLSSVLAKKCSFLGELSGAVGRGEWDSHVGSLQPMLLSLF